MGVGIKIRVHNFMSVKGEACSQTRKRGKATFRKRKQAAGGDESHQARRKRQRRQTGDTSHK